MNLLVSISFWSALIVASSCKDQNPQSNQKGNTSSSNDNIEIDPAQAEGIIKRTDTFLRTIEEKTVKSIKTSLCAISGEVQPSGSNILQSIDGVGIQATVDLARLLPATAKSPLSIKGGIEVVYWLSKEIPDEIERHIHLVPHAGASTKAGNPANLEAGIIFGCKGDPAAYGGYFGSLQAAGFGVNLGLDPGPIFERWFIESLDSKVPGGINDNTPIDYTTVNQTVRSKGALLKGVAADRTNFSSEKPNGAYTFVSNLNQDFTMDKIMREVRFKHYDGSEGETEMDFTFKRGIKFINGLYADSSTNKFQTIFENAQLLTIQPNEDPAVYKNIRMPALLNQYNEIMDYFWGDSDKLSDLRNPNGVFQTMYSVSGHLFGTNYNSKLFKTAFNTETAGSDGVGVSSVKSEKINDVKDMLFSDGPYSCRLQRERYPDYRWFRVYVGNTMMIADCIGFGQGEKYKPDVSFRLYNESDFAKIATELKRIKSFFEDFEALRYAVRHGVLQLHDSFYTRRDVFKIKTGGIQKPSYWQALTGCNSVSMDPTGAVNATTVGVAAIKGGLNSVRSKSLSGASIVQAFKQIAIDSSLGFDFSYYYPMPFKGNHQTAKGWPLIRSLRALKSINCSVEGVPEFKP